MGNMKDEDINAFLGVHNGAHKHIEGACPEVMAAFPKSNGFQMDFTLGCASIIVGAQLAGLHFSREDINNIVMGSVQMTTQWTENYNDGNAVFADGIGALAFKEAGANPNDVVYIPYDAGGKALAGLLSGETQILSTGLGEVMGARDQVKILGITAPKRIADAPDVPTLKEQGTNAIFVNWRGFFGPPGMSDAEKKKIAKMLGDVQKTPEWEAVRKRNAWVNIYNPDKKFVKFLENQTVEMTGLLKNLGVIK